MTLYEMSGNNEDCYAPARLGAHSPQSSGMNRGMHPLSVCGSLSLLLSGSAQQRWFPKDLFSKIEANESCGVDAPWESTASDRAP